MSLSVSSISKELGVSTKNCRFLVSAIAGQLPEMEIISVKKEEGEFVFNLLDGVVVKFLPPDYSFPHAILPFGLSRFSSADLAFDLPSYLGKNKHLFTAENLALLKQVYLSYETKKEQTVVFSKIAKAFKIPNTQWRTPALLTTLVKKMPTIIERILIIEKNKIKVGIKVALENDTREFRVVREVKPNFYLRLEGTNSYIDPGNVRVVD